MGFCVFVRSAVPEVAGCTLIAHAFRVVSRVFFSVFGAILFGVCFLIRFRVPVPKNPTVRHQESLNPKPLKCKISGLAGFSGCCFCHN